MTGVAIHTDEIIAEVWRVRDAYAQKQHHDLDEILRDLQRCERKSPLKFVDRRKRRHKRSD